MGIGVEASLLSTWAIKTMRQWERRAERSKELLPGAVWDSFEPVEVFEFEHDPGAVINFLLNRDN